MEKILACLKTGQNDPKCPDLSVNPLRPGFASIPYIFAVWFFLTNLLPSFFKNNCDNIFQDSSFLNYRFFRCFLSLNLKIRWGDSPPSPHHGFALDPLEGGRLVFQGMIHYGSRIYVLTITLAKNN